MMKTDVLVLGGGPGGYTAAFRAADLGKKVILVERDNQLGGVCLNVGCIPSKTYLHVINVLEENKELAKKGIISGEIKPDAEKLCEWKNTVVKRLTGGLSLLAKKRNVTVIQGEGLFISPHQMTVKTKDETLTVEFDDAVIAAGSLPRTLPNLPKTKSIMDSTDALELPIISGDLLIVGAGVIGLEMATIYSGLGVNVTIVEPEDQILPGFDQDIIAPLFRKLKKTCRNIFLKTSLKSAEEKADGLWVELDKGNETETVRFDRVLLSIGRVPNGKKIGAEKAGVNVDERGFISVDHQQRTNVKSIFAIGDIVGQPMLAHKASFEGRIAAEVIAGIDHQNSERFIPSIVYTDPEIASVGLTEREAMQTGKAYKKAVFPWMANGRSVSLGRSDGMTKLLFDPETHRLLGGTIVGPHAGELVAELVLALKKGCLAKDLAETIHPHPTLSETTMMAAEVFEGTITDL